MAVANDSSQIKQVIYALEHDFTLSSNPNSRKGGLVGLAATSIALGRVSRCEFVVWPLWVCLISSNVNIILRYPKKMLGIVDLCPF